MFSNLNVGSALDNLKSTRDNLVSRNFQDELTDIQEKYSGIMDTEGNIEKLGMGVLSGIGAIKGVSDIVKKTKAKYQEFKEGQQGKGEDLEDEDDIEDLPEPEEGLTAETDDVSPFMNAMNNDDFTTMRGLLQDEADELDNIGDDVGGDITDLVPDLSDASEGVSNLLSNLTNQGIGAVRNTISNYTSQPTVTETPLAQTEINIPDTEMGGGNFVTTEPSGLGSGDIELTDMGSQNQPSTEGLDDEGFTGEGEIGDAEDAGDGIGDAISNIFSGGIADTLNSATSGVTDALGDVASGVSDIAETATETGAEALSAGLESAGAVADAVGAATFGIGDIIGAILGIGGAIVGGVSAVAGGVSSAVSSGAEQTATSAAQQAERIGLANPPDYAGKFGSGIQSAVAGFL